MQENIRIESQSQSVLATNKVLRNTYALLGLSLIPTAIGAYIGMSMNFLFAQQHPIISVSYTHLTLPTILLV